MNRRSILRARSYFENLDNEFSNTLASLLDSQSQLESAGLVRGDVDLQEYSRPTSSAFGYVFGLASHLPNINTCKELLRQIGEEVGRAIIEFDCAVDWKDDGAAGTFNPVINYQGSLHALQDCVRSLESLAEIFRERFPENSLPELVVKSVITGVAELAAESGLCNNARSCSELAGNCEQELSDTLPNRQASIAYSDCGTGIGGLLACVCCVGAINGIDKSCNELKHTQQYQEYDSCGRPVRYKRTACGGVRRETTLNNPGTTSCIARHCCR